MANVWVTAKSILVGNLNSGLSYLITTVSMKPTYIYICYIAYMYQQKFNSTVINMHIVTAENIMVSSAVKAFYPDIL